MNEEDVLQYQNQAIESQGVLQLRLNVKELRDEIRQFLSGENKAYVYNQEDDSHSLVTEKIGDRICNTEGERSIMQSINSIINPQVVQGNYDDIRYQQHIKRIRQELATSICTNRLNWNIKKADMKLICDNIMNIIKPYLSRLLNNLERQSYSGYSYIERGDSKPENKNKIGLPWS